MIPSLFMHSTWLLTLVFVASNQAAVFSRAEESVHHWPINTWTASPVPILTNTYPSASSTIAIQEVFGTHQDFGCWNNALDGNTEVSFSLHFLETCADLCADYLMFGFANASRCKCCHFPWYSKHRQNCLSSLLTNCLKIQVSAEMTKISKSIAYQLATV